MTSKKSKPGSHKPKPWSPKPKSKPRSSPKTKSRSKQGSPRSKQGSPTAIRVLSPKMTNLPNELLELIYNELPRGKDRVALALTSKKMNSAATYKTVKRIILNKADVTAAIQHQATNITFGNPRQVYELPRMPFVKHLTIAPNLFFGVRQLRLSSLPPTL